MKQEKEIKEFTTFIMNEAKLEAPSNNFVNNVMKAIEIENRKSEVLVFKPLISKMGWFLIGLSFVVLCILMVSFNGEDSIIYSFFDFSIRDNLNRINILSNIEIPDIFIFSCLLFSVFVLFQLHYIKKYFEPHNLV